MHGINVGCGRSVTEGWTNLDNSLSLRLARARIPLAIGKKLRLVSAEHIEYIEFCRLAEIEFADASKRIPAPDASVDAIYSSHMVEHLSQNDFGRFLGECKRALKQGGILRLVIPDIDYHINAYNEDRDADRLLREMLVTAPPIDTIGQKLSVLVAGYRHHQWMYNGDSIKSLLQAAGFDSVKLLAPGETQIKDYGSLDLFERAESSVFVEAARP